jgi:hypothetical protein
MITIMVVNASLMLVSPRIWFGLPGWMRLQGVLTRERYGSGFGALQLRLLGAIILGTIIWVAVRLLIHT